MDSRSKTPEYIAEVTASLDELFSRQQNKAFDRIMKAQRGESMILKVLSMRGTPMKPSEMADALGMTKGRISSILNSLEGKGLVSRDIDLSNRRSIIVRLTDAGRHTIEEECGEVRNFMSGIFEEMGERNSREFCRLLSEVFRLMDRRITE